MTTTPLPRPAAHLRIAKSWDGGAIVLTCSPSHEKAKPVFVLEDLQAYAQQARADLEAENARLREALHRIDSVAVFLPAFEVLHEGGVEAVTQNIVEAIKATCTALESKP